MNTAVRGPKVFEQQPYLCVAKLEDCAAVDVSGVNLIVFPSLFNQAPTPAARQRLPLLEIRIGAICRGPRTVLPYPPAPRGLGH